MLLSVFILIFKTVLSLIVIKNNKVDNDNIAENKQIYYCFLIIIF